MTRIVQTLQDAGLLQRTPHPTDGRQALLEATVEGRALLREDRRRREAWLAHRLDELDEADRAVLRDAVAVLDRLASA
jgi:DNA-binding MarR family transcriptional regulator